MIEAVKKIFSDKHRRWELVIGLSVLSVMLLIASRGVLEPVESLLLDARFLMRGERRLPPGVVMIGIDEASLDHPRSGPWPWTRSNHARLLYQLDQDASRPAALGYDLLFESEDPKDETGDSSLTVRAEEWGGRLTLGYFFEKGYRSRYEKDPAKEQRLKEFALPVSGPPPAHLEKFDKVALPFSGLAKSTSLGFSNIPRDRQGVTRRLRLIAGYRGSVYPSLELMLLLKFWNAAPSDVKVMKDKIVVGRKEGKKIIPLTPEGDVLINFYGKTLPPSAYYPFILASESEDLMTPAQAQEMKKAMKDAIVLVGRTALSLQDTHNTPFDHSEPGLMVRAQGLASILEGKTLRRAGPAASAAVLFLMGALVMFVVMFLSLPQAMALTAALGIGYFLAAYVFFLNNIWLDVAEPEAGLLLVFLSMVSFRYFTALEELKKMQQELIHSAKLATVGQISSGMAHEFRNILHAIKLHVEGCTREGVSPERIQKYMGVIFKTMENAEMILNGILTFSRKNQSDKKPGSLKKTVEDTLLLLNKELLYQRMHVETQLDDVAIFDFDAGQMSQVIMNMINNARDALKESENKVVMIRLREDASSAYLDIADNGPGIPPHVLKKLFQPFVTTKAEGQGTGLGLSVSRSIVHNHGGEITVNTVQGQGTAWHIMLPKTGSQA
ncbi:MAG TPA: CHASE2 domain-containing protein [Verrucomicrobiae bacterium]|jgi:signal transduction histidine kinase|nr:CHASE2 domain-containing protein [Verrucomicrobiae bacterium]